MTRLAEELRRLDLSVAEMGGLSERAVHLSSQIIKTRRMSVEDLVGNEEKVQCLYRKIDRLCLELLAIHQPKGEELRRVFSVIKCSKEMERISHLSVNIGFYCFEKARHWDSQIVRNVVKMAEVSKLMVHEALDGLLRRDVFQASTIFQGDEALESLNKEIILRVSTSDDRQRALELNSSVFVANSFQRIGEHACQIIEEFVFAYKGKPIEDLEFSLNLDDMPYDESDPTHFHS